MPARNPNANGVVNAFALRAKSRRSAKVLRNTTAEAETIKDDFFRFLQIQISIFDQSR